MPMRRRPLPFRSVLLFSLLVASAPIGSAQQSRPPATRSGNEPESQVVEEESDRSREEAAQRNARRIFSTLQRGPYLQCGTPDSMVVRWRTDRASPSLVRFGLSETNLNFTARTRGLHTDHVVVLTNLTPNTRYFYALATNVLSGTNSRSRTNAVTETNTLAGSDTSTNPSRPGAGNRSGDRGRPPDRTASTARNVFSTNVLRVATNAFVTAPRPGTPKPTRVWVLGDPGTRQPVQRDVRNGFMKFNAGRHIDLWLLLGDNAYTAGTDEEYQGSLFLAYPELLRRSVLWPSPGNHDGDSFSSPAQAGVYYDIFTLPTQGQAGGLMSGTEAYYSFDYANAHFVALDSHDSDRSTNGFMLRWLKADLAANTQPWAVAYFHHPPYTKGSHDSDDDRDGDSRCREARERLLPVLEAGGVDLVLCGHAHAYERTALMDGHYGRSTNFTRAYVKDAGDGCEDSGGAYRKRTLGPGAHEGTIYIVAGSSGQVSGIRAVHPAMLFALNVAGSLALDFSGSRLDVSFIDTNGTRRDYFTVLKGEPAPYLGSGLAGAQHARGAELLLPAHSPDSRRREEARMALERVSRRLQSEEVPPIHSGDRAAFLDLYRATTNVALKTRLTWTLAAVADPDIAKTLTGTVTNKVRDRAISAEEEQLRLLTVRALGLVASRYEPTLDFLRKGLSGDWWYFRTNYVAAARPLEQSAADLTSAAIAALALSARPEAMPLLLRGRTNYVEFASGEPEVLVRNYAREYAAATNALAGALHFEPVVWRTRVLAAELGNCKPD
jgi:hypothetical protein